MAEAQTTRMPAMAPISWLALLFLYTPIAVVLIFSFNSSTIITQWEGFSLKWYGEALGDDALKDAAINSLIVSVGAMIFSTLIALMVALAMHGHLPRRARHATMWLMTLPLLIPEIVIALATMSFFALAGIHLGIFNVLIAHIVFCIPFAYSPIRARLGTIPPALFEAASDLYANPWNTLRYLTLPLMVPGIVSGAMLAFITSLDDVIITQFVAPPGAATLPVYIFSKVRKAITPEINAISSLLLALSITIVLVSYLINKKKAV